jgi:hypothetical protein
MGKQLTAEDAKESLNAHVASRGADIRDKYGDDIGWAELQQILQDRSCVRYPCEIRFDAEPLLPGEFAHPVPNGQNPEEGYTLCIHPFFATQLSQVPLLALYQLVRVNYGEFASPDDAETFGSNALGMTRDDYYAALCDLADQLDPAGTASSCSGSCSCH